MNDVERDIAIAKSVIGKSNEFFKKIWLEFDPNNYWDGAPCSEIACCISYMAGNLDKILVSNYAEGIYNKYKSKGRFDKNQPKLGDFILFSSSGKVPDHTGRIIGLNDNYIRTVEGNINDQVIAQMYSRDHWYIFGYCHPYYDEEETMTETQKYVLQAVRENIRLFKDCETINSQYVGMIKVVQAFLYYYGYNTNPNDELHGGHYDDHMIAEVMKWQKNSGLIQDGIWGTESWSKMEEG